MSATNNNSLQLNQLPISLEIPDDPKLAQEIISLYLKRVANTVNTKTGGLYSVNELGNNEQYNITNPQVYNDVYRTCFDLIALNGGNPIIYNTPTTFAHNIVGLTNGTLIYATCKDNTGNIFSVVFPSIYITSTNIIFTNPVGSPLIYCVAVLQYVKT